MFEILGQFHPLFLHFPICLLPLLLMIEVANKKYSESPLVSAKGIKFLWILTFISCLFTVLFGWFSLEASPYKGSEADTAEWHERISYLILLLSFINLFLQSKKTASKTKIYYASLTTSVLLIIITGHLGATLVHGEIVLQKENQITAKVLQDNQEIKTELNFIKDILPIMEKRCISCHGPKKVKGGLKLDSKDNIERGSENGAVIIPGKPEKSSFYYLLTLDEDDDDIMPGKGKPLTKEQIQTIYNWIKEGPKWD